MAYSLPRYFKDFPRNRVKSFLKNALTFDTRSLEVFRMALGMTWLVVIFHRFSEVTAFYTDEGIAPRAKILSEKIHSFDYLAQYSPHFLSGEAPLQIFLFITALVFATLLIVGWKTKTILLICWLLEYSQELRNPYVINGSHSYLRLLMFWSLFLPLGESEKKKIGRVFSMGTAAYCLQVFILYTFSALSKTGATWWKTFEAVEISLQDNFYRTLFGEWLLHFPGFLKFTTISVYILELFAPVFLLYSSKTTKSRYIVLIVLVIMHLAFWFGMAVGSFSLVCIIALIPFIPSEFWGKEIPSYLRTPSKPWWKYREKALQFLMAYVFLWNCLGLVNWEGFRSKIRLFGQVLRINQKWSMFSPNPPLTKRWLSVTEKMRNGEFINILEPKNIATDAEPAGGYRTYKDSTWISYFSRFNPEHGKIYIRYLCKYSPHVKKEGLLILDYQEKAIPTKAYSPAEEKSWREYHLCN